MAKAPGHIHSIRSGTAGATGGYPSLIVSTSSIGCGWREYGPTSDSNHFSMIDPPYNPGGAVAGFGQTGGCVLYENKASGGPSIRVFQPGIGVTGDFLNWTRVLNGTTAGYKLEDAITSYLGSPTMALVSNAFKSLPFIETVTLAIDADQWMSCPPSDTSGMNKLYNKALSLTKNAAFLTNTGFLDRTGYTFGNPDPLPWYIPIQSTQSLDSSILTIMNGFGRFSFSMWVRLENQDSDLFNFDDGTYNLRMAYSATNERINVVGNFGSAWSFSTPNNSATPGNWRNITLCYDGANVSSYINGSDTGGTSTTMSGNFSDFSDFRIGDNGGGAKFDLNCFYFWTNRDLQTIIQPSGNMALVDFYNWSVPEFA